MIIDHRSSPFEFFFFFFSIIVNPSFRDEFDHFFLLGEDPLFRKATLERARTPPPRKEICTSVPRLPFNRGAFCPRCFLQLRFPFCTRFLFFLCILISPCFSPFLVVPLHVDTVLSDSSAGKMILFALVPPC